MKVFVVNCGSSSIKYQLFSMARETVLAKGILERVGSKGAKLTHKPGRKGDEFERNVSAPDHAAGLKLILDVLLEGDIAVIDDISEIEGVGHRVVHGGEQITASTLIDDRLIKIIRNNIQLAPLHNPPNLAGIEGARAAMPNTPQVAVFDTAFLATLPPKAYRYAVPHEWYVNHGVRKYGFHGTSHRYVTLRASELFGKPVEASNFITVHLGNGCSMTAVAGGKAMDHSMGLTPLEGLVMGTRSGDVDPALVLYMIAQGFAPQDVDKQLNKGSGLLGISQFSNDMRDLLGAAEKGHEGANLAIDIFVYRILKYIGSYFTIMPSVDAVVLTGGIGENSVPIRQKICQGLARLGAVADEQRNRQTTRGKAGPITADGSKLPIWVVPTNEELMIARDTRALVEDIKPQPDAVTKTR